MLEYDARLRFLGIETLAVRRLKLDIVLAHKMYFGRTFGCDVLKRAMSTRDQRNNCHLLKEPRGLIQRLQFFSNRVVHLWNQIPENVIHGSEENLKRYIGL